MKKAKGISVVLIILLIIPALFACNARPSANAGFNFIFRYGVMARNELDTFQGKFTKDMVSEPPITINLRLSGADMEKIYQKMADIGFFDYPDDFAVTTTPGELTHIVTPYSTYYFSVEKDGQTKILNWQDEIQTPDDKAANLRELIVLIQRMIEANEEYKELPDPGSAYL
jgi:hypothetical protein